jgi:hypothetical protein
MIVGAAQFVGRETYTAYVHDPADGSVTDLGVLPGMDSSEARAINDSGTVVGSSYERDGIHQRPFVYTPADGLQELTGEDGVATDVNESGTVLGAHQDFISTGGNSGPFLWRAGTIEPIPANGIVYRLNNYDEAVGDSFDGGFIYRSGVVTLLNTTIDPSLKLNVVLAYDINDAGHITAAALRPDYSGVAVLLRPPRPDVRRLIGIQARILFGVIQDGGGLAQIGPKIGPVDPWGPLTASERRRLIALTDATLRSLVRDDAARQRAIREVREIVEGEG